MATKMTTKELFINSLLNNGFELYAYLEGVMTFRLVDSEMIFVFADKAIFTGHGSTLTIKFDEMGIEGIGRFSKSDESNERLNWVIGKGVMAWGETYTKKQGN